MVIATALGKKPQKVARALVRKPVPIVWEEDTKVPVNTEASDEASGGLTAH